MSDGAESSSESAPEGLAARALRFSLLRHMADLRRSGNVDPSVHTEAAGTLTVRDDGDGFEVSWQRGTEPWTQWVDRGDFAFFEAGDGATGASRNARHARRIALDVLGVEAPASEQRVRRRSFARPWLVARALLLPAAWIAAGGIDAIAPAVLTLAWTALDAVPRIGPVLAVLPVASLAYAGAPRAAVAGGLVCALLQALDPDPRLRWLRVAGMAAAVGFAVWLAPTWATPAVSLGLRGALLIAAAMACAVRWPFGIHERAMPLTLPFVAAGLGWDGRGREAWAVLAFSLASTALLAISPLWVRLARRRRSTHSERRGSRS